MPPHKSEDFKLSAVKHYLKIKNQKETCRIFGCSERSLMRWVDKFKNTKSDTTKCIQIYTSSKIKNIHININI